MTTPKGFCLSDRLHKDNIKLEEPLELYNYVKDYIHIEDVKAFVQLERALIQKLHDSKITIYEFLEEREGLLGKDLI